MKRMTRGSFVLAACAVLVAASSAIIQSQSQSKLQSQVSLTAEHLLQVTQVRDARFGPDGRLIFEFERPATEGSAFRTFYQPLYPAAHRTSLYVDGPGTTLFAQDAKDNYQIDAIAPGAAYLSYLRGTATRMTIGIYAFAGGATRELDVALDNPFAPQWISRTKLLIPTIAPDRVPQVFIDRLSDAWRAARDGREVTATQLGSGRYAPTDDAGRGLVIADAQTRVTCRLATGLFIDRVLAPDGKRLAVVRREAQGAPNPTGRVESFRLPYERTQLMVFDLDECGDARGRLVAEGFDVLPGSIGWSVSGKRLAFVARQQGSPWADARLWTWDVSEAAARPADLGSSSIGRIKYDDYWTVRSPRVAWLQDTLIVEGAMPSNMTAAFGDAATELVGTTPDADALLLLSDGRLWAVTADGTRRRVIPQIDESVSIWRRSETERYPASTASPVGESLLLLTRPKRDDVNAGARKALFVDMRTETLAATVDIPASARILDVDMDAHRVAFVDERHNVGTLSIADANADAHVREVRRFNEHLRDVVGGRPVRLDHTGPDGRPRVSWLLMPPDWKAADGPIATVVQIYPGKENWQRDANASLGNFSRFGLPPLIPQLLAAQGYAVLLPGIPLPSAVPRDSLPGLADAVSAAVDAAIAAGYADRTRLAIEGHSYGGYGVLGVIAQTDRFKAALAMNGFSDLISKYGIVRFDQRLEGQFGVTLPNVSGMESGQDGMGTAPWRDTDRYLRNSPLMSVEQIKTPLMLVHGDLDSTVPTTQSEEMFTALTRLHRDAVFVRYWGEGHTITSPANLRDFWNRRLAWYREHLQ